MPDTSTDLPPQRIIMLPLAFMILSLVALVLVPILLTRWSRPLRDDIVEIAEPADMLVDRIEYAFAEELTGVTEFILTGRREFLRLREHAVERERATFAVLEPLARELGPPVPERLRELESMTARWHAAVDTIDEPGEPRQAQRIRVQQAFYRRTLRTATALDASIDRAVDRRRERIRAAARLELGLTIALAVLALAAMTVVLWLGIRLRKATEQAWRRRRELQEMTENRLRFMRGVSHDLKNPLGAADAHAQLLDEGVLGELTAEQRDSVHRIRRSARAALQLIGDLHDLARAEAGRLEIHPRRVDMTALVQELGEEHGPTADGVGLTLEVQADPDLPVLSTDPARVRQILSNLVSNAVKYTEAGGVIRIRAEVRENESAPGPGRWLAVDVSDTGRGVPEDKREEIFEEFSRLESGETRGAGLGLAISRRIARLLGGDVTVASVLGEGSTFTLWLPLEAESAQRPT